VATFSRDGNVLAATGRPELPDYPEFGGLCRDLLEKTRGKVVLDFGEADSLPSVYLGAIFNLHRDLQDQGREMELRLSTGVRRVVKVAGLGRFIRLVD
jgi:anti-anti-sigma regulatory factor